MRAIFQKKFRLNFRIKIILNLVIAMLGFSSLVSASCDIAFHYAVAYPGFSEKFPIQLTQLSNANKTTLAEHKVFSTAILPGSAYVDLMLSMIKRLGNENFETISIKEITIQDRFLLNPPNSSEEAKDLFTITTYSERRRLNFQINIVDSNGKIYANSKEGKLTKNTPLNPTIAHDGGYDLQFSQSRLYEILKALGLNYGPNFRLLDYGTIHTGNNFVQATIRLKDLDLENSFKQQASITPHILDASLHAVAGLIVSKFNSKVFEFADTNVKLNEAELDVGIKHVYVPMQFEEVLFRINFNPSDYTELYVKARIIEPLSEGWLKNPPKRIFYDLDILTPDQKPVLQIRRGSLVMVTPGQIQGL